LSYETSNALTAQIDFELEEQKLSPRYPLLELFVAAIDAQIEGNVTQKVSHRLISEYFSWSDAKVKKLIQRLVNDSWLRVHSERRGYWVRYQVNSIIVDEVRREKLLDLKKFQKIKHKQGIMRNDSKTPYRTTTKTSTETVDSSDSETPNETTSEKISKTTTETLTKTSNRTPT
jgi:predicted transcriptional regulator